MKYLLGWERSRAGCSDGGNGNPTSLPSCCCCCSPSALESAPSPPPLKGPMCRILLMPRLTLASFKAASRFSRAALSRLLSHMHQMPQHRVNRKNKKYLSSIARDRKGDFLGGVGGGPWEVALGSTEKDIPQATRVKLLVEGPDDTGHCKAMQQGER